MNEARTVGDALSKTTNGGQSLASTASRLSDATRNVLLNNASDMNRVGVSPVGKALQKHSVRPGSWLEGMASGGNAAENTRIGKNLVQNILQNGKITYSTHPDFGEVVKVRLSDGAGAWWEASGRFIGFLERYTPKN